MHRTRREIFAAAAALFAGRALRAADDDVQFSTGVKVVNVFATVRDPQGRIVKDLTKEDFAIEEDGAGQVIRYFAAHSDLPLTLGLLVDTSGSMRGVIDTARGASFQFIDQMLRDKRDQAFVIHFDREVELLQDLTSDRRELENAIGLIAADRPQMTRRGGGAPQGAGYPTGYPGGYPGGGVGYPGRRGRGYPGGGYPPQGGGRPPMQSGGTSLYDAVVLASDELMRRQQGRKAMLLISDGMDTGSKLSFTDAVNAAQRAETMVYSIYIHDGGAGLLSLGGINFPSGGGGKGTMEKLAKQTGGGFYEHSGKQSFAQIYARIDEELRNQYSLGYSPETRASAASYRKIKVIVKGKSYTVQSRDGYHTS